MPTTFVLMKIEQMRKVSGLFPVLLVALSVLQLAVILFSWIVYSVAPSFPCRSMLNGEGARWFLGNFVDNLSCPVLAWLVLCSMAYGSFVHSGFGGAFSALFRKRGRLAYRQRHAFILAVAVIAVVLASVALLAFVPHAVLLSVSGSLFPSAFSSAVVPLAALIVILASVSYGLAGGGYATVGDVFKGLCAGIGMSAPLFPVYVLAVQLYYSILYVFLFI